jgi:aspartate/methionine/tyrosine aminotransferase
VVVSDEVYDRIVFGEMPHQSIYTRPGMARRTCVVGSFSKGFAMTG